MPKRRNWKNIHLISGGEEGFGWWLTINISEKSHSFSGYFRTAGEFQKKRDRVRSADREFFKARLSLKYMADKVLHHLWRKNTSEYIKVVLLHKSEHSNGGMGTLRDRTKWIEKEDWL